MTIGRNRLLEDENDLHIKIDMWRLSKKGKSLRAIEGFINCKYDLKIPFKSISNILNRINPHIDFNMKLVEEEIKNHKNLLKKIRI